MLLIINGLTSKKDNTDGLSSRPARGWVKGHVQEKVLNLGNLNLCKVIFPVITFQRFKNESRAHTAVDPRWGLTYTPSQLEIFEEIA